MENHNVDAIENSNIKLLIKAAEKQNISWTLIDDDRYKILLEKGKRGHIITAKSLGLNSHQSIELTKSKYKTYSLLEKKDIPVLPKLIVKSIDDYLKNYKKVPFPQVIKPTEGEKGHHVYLNIKDKKTALKALKLALENYKNILVEPHFEGHDIRIFCLAHKVIGISERKPPEVVGDGKNTIEELIEKENKRRAKLNQKANQRMLNRIVNIPRITWYLEKQNLKFSSILPKGKKQKLHGIPNYSAGGSVIALGNKTIHPSFVKLSQKISRLVGLTIAGIDFIIKDLREPATNRNCIFIELNSDPGIRLHDLPNIGKPQHVAEKVLKYILKVAKT